jgi:hypothetical protein
MKRSMRTSRHIVYKELYNVKATVERYRNPRGSGPSAARTPIPSD